MKKRVSKASEFPVVKAAFLDFEEDKKSDQSQEIEHVDSVPIKLVAELGRKELTLGEIMTLKENSIIALDKVAGYPAELYIDDKYFARAEILVLEENFGVKILDIRDEYTVDAKE